MRIRMLVASVMAIALASSFSPALADVPPDAPPESYLYIVDAKSITVKPNKDGSTAKIVVRNATVTRFSDRPYRHEHYMSVAEMFAEFGSDPKTGKWEDPTPNAGVSIAGHRTEIIDIRRAKGDERRLVLHVRDVRYALKALEGVGAIFIDNVTATTYPVSKSVTWTQLPGLTADVTATSATSLTVTFRTDKTTYDPVVVDSKTVKTYVKVDLPNGVKAELAMTLLSAGCMLINATIGTGQYVLGRCI